MISPGFWLAGPGQLQGITKMKCPNFQFENPEGNEVLLGLWGQKGRKEEWAPVRMK